jgi:hypothetical protein
MTTGARIMISEHSVREALAEWMLERKRAELEAGDAERARADRERTYLRTPDGYAQELAPYVFSLLQKHAEIS